MRRESAALPAAMLRVLVLPPTTRDAQAIEGLLLRNSLPCTLCASMDDLCSLLAAGAGGIIVSEESLYRGHEKLACLLRNQPVWSDLPIIVLSKSGAELPALAAIVGTLGNVSVLERPVRMTTLLSVVRSLLRARERQYQVRDHLIAQKNAETALAESREQLQLVVRSAQVGVWYCPLPFERLEWDETVKAHFHLPPDAEVSIEDFYNCLHPNDRDRVRQAIERSISERSAFDIDYRTVAPQGDHVNWIRAIGSCTYDDAGAPIRFTGITIDVTDRVLVQEDLQASQERLQLAVQTGKLGVWEVDLHTNRMSCSITCKANFGRRADDRFGYDEFWAAVHPDDLARVRSAVAASVQTRSEYDTEYRTIWPDGTLHWVLARGRPDSGPDGTPDRLIGVTLDITDRKAAEVQRAALLDAERAARAEAERAGQMKDEFLATLSHELRTPLNAILGWAQILRMPSVPEQDVSEGIAIIERNARAQSQIIEDLLDMSRIISGKVRLEVQRLDLAAVIRAAVDTVQPAAFAKEIHISTLLESIHSPVNGDPSRLQQVFWNLLSNAVKFTPRGGQVQIVLEQMGLQLEASVSDNGEGIDPVFLPHIFDRFRQANATASRTHGGLGLGLAIVRQLVELHGGTIRVHSRGKNEGSTFVVSLPITAAPSDASSRIPVKRHPAKITRQSLPHRTVRMAGVRVVVVDDEPDARLLLKRLLEDCDVEVLAAESAEIALELVRSNQPHVLISDIGMPGEDGYSLIRRVRALADEAGGKTPAVALTAYARAEDRVSAIVAGFQHHLAKPVEPAELIAIVASLAGRAAT